MSRSSLIALSIVVGGAVLAGAQDADKKTTEGTAVLGSRTKVAIPPIDAEAPKVVRSATFAVG